MHVLYEEDGAFKTATILADNETSLQVETASGKRAKIKTANVLLRYLEPPPSELLNFLLVNLPTSILADRGIGLRRSRRQRCCWPCIQRPSIFIAKGRGGSAKPLQTFSQLLWPVLKRSVSRR